MRNRVQPGRNEAIPSHTESRHVRTKILELHEHIAGMDISRHLTGNDQHPVPSHGPGLIFLRWYASQRAIAMHTRTDPMAFAARSLGWKYRAG